MNAEIALGVLVGFWLGRWAVKFEEWLGNKIADYIIKKGRESAADEDSR